MATDRGRYALVVEQTLGHAAHSRNLERVLAEDAVAAELIKLNYRPPDSLPLLERLPGLRTWSYQASREARTRVQRALARGPLDALFLHTQVAALLLPGLMRTIPTVVSMDATPRNFDQIAAAYQHRPQPEYVERLKLQVNKRVFDRAAALVTWSHWAARSLERDYGVDTERIHVIHPGVDLRLFGGVAVRRPGPPRILFVGGQFERKGGADLLRAMERLGDAVELDIVTGSCPAVPPTGRIRVHRGLEPQSPELLDLFLQADIFALPTHGDCFGQVVEEAMASGLPVVATNVGAIPEMVRDGVTGYLVRQGDLRQLTQALGDLAGSPGRRAAMGQAGQREARERHDAMKNDRAILDLLAEVSRRERRALRRPA